MTGVHAREWPQLTARAAAVASHLYMSRQWRLEALLASSFRRCDLIHYIEFAQYDETPLKVRIRGGPLVASEVASFQQRRHAAIQNGPSRSAICRISNSGQLSVSASQSLQAIVQTRQHCGMAVRLGTKLITLACRSVTRLAVVDSCKHQ